MKGWKTYANSLQFVSFCKPVEVIMYLYSQEFLNPDLHAT